MRKYTKHYMEIALTKKENEFFFEEMEVYARDNNFLDKYFFDEELLRTIIESKYTSKRYVVRYPEVITSGRPLAKIRFYDINYIIDDGLIYESTKHNYSNWICFGKKEYRDDLPDQAEESWCFNGYASFIMQNGDITFQEFMEKNFEKTKKIKKIKKQR